MCVVEEFVGIVVVVGIGFLVEFFFVLWIV